MCADLTEHELEVILRALEEHRANKQGRGLSTDDASKLLEKLRPCQSPRRPEALGGGQLVCEAYETLARTA
jgi:hypothetical protein